MFMKPIPGFKCVAFKHSVQKKIYLQTKHMTAQELVQYFQKRSNRDPLYKKIKFFQIKKAH